MITRRKFMKLESAAGAGLLSPWKGFVGRAFAAIPGGSLDPITIPK